MTDDYKEIPGTNGIPDNRIHRASLWLERMKFAERAFNPEEAGELENVGGDEISMYLREFEMDDLTPLDLAQAARFYGGNMRRALFGNRLQIFLPNPVKGGEMEQVDLDELFGSLWIDAFQHGAASALGKYGYSNQEISERGPEA